MVTLTQLLACFMRRSYVIAFTFFPLSASFSFVDLHQKSDDRREGGRAAPWLKQWLCLPDLSAAAAAAAAADRPRGLTFFSSSGRGSGQRGSCHCCRPPLSVATLTIIGLAAAAPLACVFCVA